jgi:hypothetical protein
METINVTENAKVLQEFLWSKGENYSLRDCCKFLEMLSIVAK